ncbi:undecaprenyldiphospho-muramoylpentapeptide beta-N-acetylglucosaminyltransferase [Candidatus Falkowbacteria bacterium]|nr:undecaprenyldiphospho-muramoylpentapeptide beta-N-acetylglucosaminyltransferase [Candidatus Falkowbacteria bacterium]
MTKKIILTGGGTGGSVTPLLAIAEAVQIEMGAEAVEFVWVGSKKGIERVMVERTNIAYKSVASGKLRRYCSWQNLVDPFLIAYGFVQSFFFLKKERPDLVMTAGSFVSVPVLWAAKLLKIPTVVHQQDLRPGLANKLMLPCATVITVTFQKSLADFGPKSRWLGNPVRQSFVQAEEKIDLQKVNNQDFPTVLILGGGTGAEAINVLVVEALTDLNEFCKIVHLTGLNKQTATSARQKRYEAHDFLNENEMAAAYLQADLVVTRAGLGVLSELAYLGKPALVIPIPNSHQEDNAQYFKEAEAAIILDQNRLTPEVFAKIVKESLADKKLISELSKNIQGMANIHANHQFVLLIKELIKQP